MSKKEPTVGQPKSVEKGSGNNQSNVVAIGLDRCKVEGCKSKSTKAGFCDEHYTWFKEGLVTVGGQFAKDFDKKYQNFMKFKKKVA